MRALLLFLSGVSTLAAEPALDRAVIAAEIQKQETGSEADHATGDWGGLRTRLIDRGIHLYAGYAGEVLANVSGGLRRGAIYEGLFEMSVEIETEKAKLWNEGKFRVSSIYPHGRGISEKFTGDITTASNIDAFDSVRLYEAWYEHRFGGDKFSLRLGQLLADEEFTFTDAAQDFLNSGFGWPAFISGNVVNTGPAFFVAAPGVRLRYEPNDDWFFQAGVYDGDTFDSREGDPHPNASGTRIHLSEEQGAFAIAEAGYLRNRGEEAAGMPGAYKLGAWIHTADFPSNFEDETGGEIASSGLNPRPHSPNFGVYLAAEQMVWREEKEQGITVFARAGGSPPDRSVFEIAIDAGFRWTGALPSRDEDELGVGVVYARLSRDIRRFERLDAELNGSSYGGFSDHETVLEAFYSVQVKKWWSIQPDVQWIFNPGGRSAASDALVVGVRSNLVF